MALRDNVHVFCLCVFCYNFFSTFALFSSWGGEVGEYVVDIWQSLGTESSLEV